MQALFVLAYSGFMSRQIAQVQNVSRATKSTFFAFCTQTYIFTYLALSTGLERA
jgi:hypothetical protein